MQQIHNWLMLASASSIVSMSSVSTSSEMIGASGFASHAPHVRWELIYEMGTEYFVYCITQTRALARTYTASTRLRNSLGI